MTFDDSQRPSRSKLRWTLLVIAVLLLALVIDGAYSLLKIRRLLSSARIELTEGIRATRAVELESAADHFQKARELTDSASGFGSHPGMVTGSFLPFYGGDVRAIRRISRSANLASRAGAEALRAVETLNPESTDLVAALIDEGSLDLAKVGAVEPFISRADGLLREADGELDDLPAIRLARLQSATEELAFKIEEAQGLVRNASETLNALPPLLGEGDAKRYFLAFQAPGEARGTGGFIGTYGILGADEGRVALERVGPIRELTPHLNEKVAAPAEWFELTWGGLSALEQWQNVNLSPNFPVVSEVILNMYEASRGERLDGVIAMDPATLESLMPAVGAITPIGSGPTVTESNVRSVLTERIYTDLDEPTQNIFLGRLIEAFWERISEGDFDAAAFSSGFADAIATQHVKVFAVDESVETSLKRLGVAGDYDNKGPNPLLVFHNSFSASKVDVFAHRDIEVGISFDESGAPRVTTRVTVRNDSPTGGSPTLIGPSTQAPDSEAGLNRMLLSVLLPEGAVFDSFLQNGGKDIPVLEWEGEHQVVSGVLDIAAGRRGWIEVSFAMPGAFELGEDVDLPFTLIPQPAPNPDNYSFEVDAPEGYEVAGGGGNLQGALLRPVTLLVDLDRE